MRTIYLIDCGVEGGSVALWANGKGETFGLPSVSSRGYPACNGL